MGFSNRISIRASLGGVLLSLMTVSIESGTINLEKKDCPAHEKALEVCILPREKSLCRNGFVESCTSAVCYDSGVLCQSMEPAELGFLAICLASEALSMNSNCECLFCRDAESDRLGATECYGEGNAIDVAEPVRGNCEAGGCCNPELPLCELESYFHFMSLAYGVQQGRNSGCSSSLDYFGPNHGCSVLSDGKNNDAIVCSDAKITQDRTEKNFCDITFSGTNDAVDVLRELFHLFAPTKGREVTFGSEQNLVSVNALAMLADIALGSEDDPNDGIMEIAYEAAKEKGCFSRDGAAVHLMAHSLGAVVANFFALRLSAEYPDVFIKMTTSGEPSILLEPLQGKAKRLPVWQNKQRYINGRVLPRGQVFDDVLLPREYGLYQDYCWVSQSVPGGFTMENEETELFFLCEAKRDQTIEFFIAGREGCAAGRDDVLNEMPNFPHRGAIEFLPNENVAQRLLDMLKDRLESRGLDNLSDVVDFFNVVLTIADENYRDAFFQLLELHFIRRSMHTLNRISQNGEMCDAAGVSNALPNPIRKPCNGSPSFFCFSQEVTVEEQTKGTIQMRDLKIGDMVLNAQGVFDRVYSFGHYDPNIQGAFLQFYLSGVAKPIELSKDHMVFVGGSAVPASTISIGGEIDLAEGGTAAVVQRNEIVATGAFAPFTTSGTIAINGVAASSYISLQDSAVLLVGGYRTFLPMQLLAHVFSSPKRLACMLHQNRCERETYDNEGVSTAVSRPYKLGMWLLDQNSIIFVACFSPLFIMGLMVYAIELAILNCWVTLAGVGIIGLGVAFRVNFKSHPKSKAA